MIELTAEQLEQVRRAKEAGEHRIVMATTPEQDATLRQALAEEDAALAENKADAIRRHAALNESGFSGDLRRAVARSRRNSAELAALIGVTEKTLDAFRCGEEELPSGAVSRLVSVLGLRLMAEIR